MPSDHEPHTEEHKTHPEHDKSRDRHSSNTHTRRPPSTSSFRHPSIGSSKPPSVGSHTSASENSKRSSGSPSTKSTNGSKPSRHASSEDYLRFSEIKSRGDRRHRSRSSSTRRSLVDDDKSNYGDAESECDSVAASSIGDRRYRSRSRASSKHRGARKDDNLTLDDVGSDNESVAASSGRSSVNSNDRMMVEVMDRYTGVIEAYDTARGRNRDRSRSRSGSDRYRPIGKAASTLPSICTRSSMRRLESDSESSVYSRSGETTSSIATTLYSYKSRDSSIARLVSGGDEYGRVGIPPIEVYIPLSRKQIEAMSTMDLKEDGKYLFVESSKKFAAIKDTDYGDLHLQLLKSWLKMIHFLEKKLTENRSFKYDDDLREFFQEAETLHQTMKRGAEADSQPPKDGDQFLRLQKYGYAEHYLIKARGPARKSAAKKLRKDEKIGFNDYEEEYAFHVFAEHRNCPYKYKDAVKMLKEAKDREEAKQREEHEKSKRWEDDVDSMLNPKDQTRAGHGHRSGKYL